MTAWRVAAVAVLAFLVVAPLRASGRLGIYGIIERVVFEPSEPAAERLQVWGAFMYVDGFGQGAPTSAPRRGYLYFTLPPAANRGDSQRQLARLEWNDLKAVAGTGQAVGFGAWWYFGLFTGLQPDIRTERPFIAETTSPGGAVTDLRVRSASERPSGPAVYQMNAGIVKLSDGSHGATIRQLKDTLK